MEQKSKSSIMWSIKHVYTSMCEVRDLKRFLLLFNTDEWSIYISICYYMSACMIAFVSIYLCVQCVHVCFMSGVRVVSSLQDNQYLSCLFFYINRMMMIVVDKVLDGTHHIIVILYNMYFVVDSILYPSFACSSLPMHCYTLSLLFFQLHSFDQK